VRGRALKGRDIPSEGKALEIAREEMQKSWKGVISRSQI